MAVSWTLCLVFLSLLLLRFPRAEPGSTRAQRTPPAENPPDLRGLSTTILGSSSAVVTIAMNKRPPTSPPASSRPQRTGRPDGEGDVMPTLDMTLFDWTDYEDMKPVDTWPPSREKDKRTSQNLPQGNVDVESRDACGHHQDCLPAFPTVLPNAAITFLTAGQAGQEGSCCDLRQHECRLHNRGLNNKCYHDCMCEDGFRCYAKFQRRRRVTRRRGRCVAPGSASSQRGAFISV